ncbi:MAG: ABC transporter ATP-binding protein [Planctomycetota bacterium]
MSTEDRSADEKRAILRVERATRVYRMGQVDVHALREATLAVYEGEFLAIVGPSGSGKTTLLNLIGGMDRPTSGAVHYRGEEISRYSDKDLTRYRRTQVGFIFQFFNLIPSLTALENVQVATEIAPDPIDPMRALETVGIGERADHFPGQLSGGEQQRVAIARALAGNPAMFLCDEPTGSVDSDTAVQVLEILRRLTRELAKTVIVITHNTAIPRMADRVALLHDGSIKSVTVNEAPVSASEVRW